MRICVVGTGYVGLTAGAGFADMGNEVVCCDVDAEKIEALRAGRIPIHEPGLDALCTHNAREGRLSFTTDVSASVAGAEVILLAVGTPPAADGAADLGQTFAAAETIAKALTGFAVVVVKSTVPVGTGDRIEAVMRPLARHPFAVASNPEFLKEGDAVNDFMKPERIIVGASDPLAVEALRRLYAPFTRTSDRLMVMDRRSAELTKYTANAMLATRISFMNEIAALCDALGADVEMVRKGVGADGRIGPKFLYPGPGFGGSCFGKDLRALAATGRQAGRPLAVVETVSAVNEAQKRVLGDKVIRHFGGDVRGKRVAVWGLAFKPRTDDLREAPALVLVDQMLAAGAEVVATDPVAIPGARRRLGDRVRFEDGNYAAAAGADALVLVTEWHDYRRPSFERLKQTMRTPVVFDGRNAWDPKEVRAAGLAYYGIGRGGPK